MARALTGWSSALRGIGPCRPLGRVAIASGLAPATRARRSRTDARRRAHRFANSDRLLRSGFANGSRAPSGGLRSYGIAPCPGRSRFRDNATALARPPAGADDARSRRILAYELLRRPKGS